jgi:hypothetical protein
MIAVLLIFLPKSALRPKTVPLFPVQKKVHRNPRVYKQLLFLNRQYGLHFINIQVLKCTIKVWQRKDVYIAWGDRTRTIRNFL